MNRRELLKNTALFLGYSAVTGAFSNAFIACATTSKTTAPKARFLSTAQYDLLSAVADTILPKTKTPSASEVGVPQHLDAVVRDLMDTKDQAKFVKNLVELDAKCQTKNGKSFVASIASEREAFLTMLDKEPNEFAATMWGITLANNPPVHTFFNDLKGMVVSSYFTRQAVAEKILAYEPIPGDYIGCIPYNGENVWSGG